MDNDYNQKPCEENEESSLADADLLAATASANRNSDVPTTDTHFEQVPLSGSSDIENEETSGSKYTPSSGAMSTSLSDSASSVSLDAGEEWPPSNDAAERGLATRAMKKNIPLQLPGTSFATASTVFDYKSTSESSSEDEDLENDTQHNEGLTSFAKRYPVPSRPRRASRKTVPIEKEVAENVPKKQTRGKVFCFYCEEEVLQFSRHITRHHQTEFDVIKIMALRPKSKERKQMLYALRNRGNYLLSKTSGNLKPVRKPYIDRDSTQPLPCRYCYGFYARKHLWRHTKKCPSRLQRGREMHSRTLSLAQNMLLSQVHGNEYLLNTVFPRMQADEVTKVVKCDPLICAFGARYAKIHQEKYQINVVSRKMREVAKLLIAFNDGRERVHNLFEMLDPKNYDAIVEAARIVAKFNTDTKQFASPTYAMNISTSLKDCCEVACTYLNKYGQFKDKGEQEAAEFPFRRLYSLISSEWKFDVSHNANNDLRRASMNKITIVPLASDLRTFKAYLEELSEECYNQLASDNSNESAFRQLVETIYARVILLCRKRSGELSRLPVQTYVESGNRSSYEEFVDVLTPAEMILIRRLKRVVVRGKRQPAAIIFTESVQRHIELILSVRERFVGQRNIFLFSVNSGGDPITGHIVISKLAKRAQLQRPEAITTRSLRKHLATVCQVLSMNEQDIEQLSTFMGHTASIHMSQYRLPNDIFQTAKISKLLLMMESGAAAKFKGQSLDAIDVDLDSNLFAETTEHEDMDETFDIDPIPTSPPTCIPQPLNRTPGTSNDVAQASRNISFDGVPTSTPKKAIPRKQIHVKWNDEERKIVKSYFAQHITDGRPPKRHECESLMSANEILRHRQWTSIKIFVVNEYNKKLSKKK